MCICGQFRFTELETKLRWEQEREKTNEINDWNLIFASSHRSYRFIWVNRTQTCVHLRMLSRLPCLPSSSISYKVYGERTTIHCCVAAWLTCQRNNVIFSLADIPCAIAIANLLSVCVSAILLTLRCELIRLLPHAQCHCGFVNYDNWDLLPDTAQPKCQ